MSQGKRYHFQNSHFVTTFKIVILSNNYVQKSRDNVSADQSNMAKRN